LLLSPAAIDELRTYSWPGNVRELQNSIERAVILSEGDAIQPRHLSLSFRQAAAPLQPETSPWEQIDLSGTMADALRRVSAEVERRKIERALKEAGGNKQRAADALQISYKTLLQKLKEIGLAEE
jgi:DNA-binding NtrC family response regulator